MSTQPDRLPRSEMAAHLAATQLFALLSPDSLARLAAVFETVRMRPGQVVAKEGTVDRTLWVVVDGSVAIDRAADGGRTHLGVRGYGTVIGARGVFTGQRRTDSAVVFEPSRLLYSDRDELWAALRDDPEAFDRLVLPDAVRKQLDDMAQQRPTEGEVSVRVFRRHWLALARGLLVPVVLLALALPLGVFAAPLAPSPALVLFAALLALGGPLLLGVWAFYDYWQDQLIVTNRRVIHIERTPLIDTRRSEAPLERIQDVQVVTPNLAARLLGYGTVRVLTAGSERGMRFELATAPSEIRRAVFDQVDRAKEEVQREQRAWMLRQIRRAIGGERLTPDEVEPPQARPPVLPPDLERTPAGPIGALRRALTYLLPKMRHVDGARVTWRKHWWVLLRRTWFVLLPLALVTLSPVVLYLRSPDSLPGAAWLVLPWLVLLAALWWQFEDWRNDLYQVTDEHVVDIEALPLGLRRERRQASLEQIQDIHYVVPNMLATLLSYGDVIIETAAESGNFTFLNVYDPAAVQEEIFARLDRQRAEKAAREEAQRAAEISRWLAAYHHVANDEAPQHGQTPSHGPGGRP